MQKCQLKEEVAQLRTLHAAPQPGQGAKRVSDHLPICEQLNVVELVRAHITQLQVDLNLVKSLWFQKAIKHMYASLFFETIQTAQVPERFNVSHFKLYPSTTDHMAHIQYYCRRITFCQQGNALLYKVFLAILDERCVAWFQQLPSVV